MKRLLSAALLLLPLLSACRFDAGTVFCEDGTTPGPQLPVPATIRELQTQLGAARQTFTYTPGQTNVFTGAKGTIVTIPGNAFVRNSQPLTVPIQLTLREIYSRTDMVLSNMPTVSNGALLESAGEVFLRALDQDSTVRMAPGAVIQLQTQNPPNLTSRDSMRLFVAPSGMVPNNCFNWNLNIDPGSTLTPTATGNTITVSSVLYNNGIGWFNCDRFYNTPNPLPLVVNVPATNVSLLNTMVFAIFRDFNGTLSVCDFTAPNAFQAPNVPQGARVSIVVIRTANDTLYYGRQDGTVQAGTPFAPVLQETTAAALLTALNTL
ncbi:hypothetical protein [Hymenobacter rubripertinctus]|uniref:Uncharacterized protein n=1 Tax=Hymenobacter rubripertinctus TaxID=2029981 RepID=A0A418QVH2_9BACT|nr:hypothetical protein [Hymenobacter rubripertinctus]RIY09229.1 hypothetical protein D0T11_12375 [Hymenobacter rubripertinctus]